MVTKMDAISGIRIIKGRDEEDGRTWTDMDNGKIESERIAIRCFMSPFQGLKYLVASIPRALPWANIFRPYRADKKILLNRMGRYKKNVTVHVFYRLLSFALSGLKMFVRFDTQGVALG